MATAIIRLFTVLIFILPKSYADVEDVLFKIIGGSHTKIENYPYLGCLMYNEVPRCGAALISYKHLITAAHCTKDSNPCSLKVRLGSTYNSFGGKVFQVIKITPHPEYNTTTKEHDISVLELHEMVSPYTAQPIGIADFRTNCPSGVFAEIMGWGTLEVGAKTGSTMLRCTRVPIVARDVCQMAYSKIKRTITDNMLCAGDMSTGGRDTCQGDSGGPLVWDRTMIGIVSFGKGCGNKDYPGVYVNIKMYLHFIYKALGVRIK